MNDFDVSANDSLDALLGELAEEFTRRLQRGEQPDIEEYARQHPQAATLIRQVFPSLQLMGQAAEDEAAHTDVKAQPTTGILGDFRIQREVGRGGMGVVYEAEQISLGRRVALKVLPFAATMDPRHLQRFQNEARAAASLDHAHVVKVHAVGQERGVHYYAMQFIDGQSLADIIRQFRQQAGLEQQTIDGVHEPSQRNTPETIAYPKKVQHDEPEPNLNESQAQADTDSTPAAAISTEHSTTDPAYYRRVAEWGIQAAEGLEHAHQLGVVHRDIKPGNLMVDGQGDAWITDFGLARIEADSNLTLSGDMLGTLRYMSPEQAQAKHGLVDHHTDIYSLGVTLYELLTLQPAFAGQDRAKLLRHVIEDEPKAPRQINRKIPVDLETIVLKAMAKEPKERYASAQEMADDLRRCMDDEPIRARRPSWGHKMRRLARRNKPLLWSMAAGLLLAMVVIGAGLGWFLADRAAHQAATHTRAASLVQRVEELQEQRQWHKALDLSQRADFLLRTTGGDAELDQKVKASMEDCWMAINLDEIRLQQAAVNEEGRFGLASADREYAKAFKGFGIDLAQLAPDEAARRIRARSIALELTAALDEWAWVRQRKLKEPSWKRLVRIARLADPDPWRDKLRQAWLAGDSDKLVAFGASEKISAMPATIILLARMLKGRNHLNEAVAVLRQAQQKYSRDFWINHDLAISLRNLDPALLDEAIGFFRVAVAVRSESPGAYLNLGNALKHKGQLDEAIAVYRKAIQLNKDVAPSYFNLGNILRDKGELDEAINAYRKAIQIKKDFPEAYCNFGVALWEKGRLDEAIAAYRKAIQIKKDFPKAYCNLGSALRKKGQLDEAINAYRKAIQIKKDFPEAYTFLGIALSNKGRLDEAIAAHRKAIQIKEDFRIAYFNLGVDLRQKGQLDEAIAAYQQAIRLKNDDAEAYNNLGNALGAKGQVAEAIAAYQQAIRLKNDDAEVYFNLGNALQANGQLAEAIVAHQQALRLRPNMAEAYCRLGSILENQGKFVEALKYRRRGHELGSQRPDWRYPSAEWVEQCERLAKLQAKVEGLGGAFTLGSDGLRIQGKFRVSKPKQFGGILTKKSPLYNGRYRTYYKLKVQPGTIYQIDLESKDFDPYLWLKDATGQKVAGDDDGGKGLNSRLFWLAEKGGVYDIDALALQPGTTGTYTLTIREFAPKERTQDPSEKGESSAK